MSLLHKREYMMHYLKYLYIKEQIFLLMLDKKTRLLFRAYSLIFYQKGFWEKIILGQLSLYWLDSSQPIFIHYEWDNNLWAFELLNKFLKEPDNTDPEYGSYFKDVTVNIYANSIQSQGSLFDKVSVVTYNEQFLADLSCLNKENVII